MAILYKDIKTARIRYNVRFTSKIYGCKNVNDIEIHTNFQMRRQKRIDNVYFAV